MQSIYQICNQNQQSRPTQVRQGVSQARGRVDTSSIYIRNAIELPEDKPADNASVWSPLVEFQIEELRQLLTKHRPSLVFCFGAFSFEFARRALGEEPKYPYRFWGATTLSEQFTPRIEQFDPKEINALPLLHTSISRGRFAESHNFFSGQGGGNYFDYVGNNIADKLLQFKDELGIWIE